MNNADTLRASCEDCGWTLDRSLDAGNSLTEEDNREIVSRVVRSHAFKCGSSGDNPWGTLAEVRLDTTAVATDGGQDLLEDVDADEIPDTIEISFPVEDALNGNRPEEMDLDEDSIQLFIEMEKDIQTSRALREVAEDLVDEDDLPQATSLLWIDRAEVYSLCGSHYDENRDGAWTGSTENPHYEELRAQKEQDLAEGRPCSFCRDERIRDLVDVLEDEVDLEVTVER